MDKTFFSFRSIKRSIWAVNGVLFFTIVSLSAAPLRPLGPFDITGRISEATWVPQEFRRGKPGWSGSLGHDQTIPAHFLLKLTDYSGIPAEKAITITRYISFQAYGGENPSGLPPFVILKINSTDQTFLKKGMKIQVTGYSVRGDEGGTWTSYSRIKIIQPV